MAIRKIDELNIKDKRVFVRVDFNVPIEQGRVTEPHRIDSALPTIRLVLSSAKKVIIASHLGRPGGKKSAEWSLAPVRDYVEQALATPVTLAPDCIGAEVEALVREPHPKIILLENLRFHKEEEKNDLDFSRALASLADVYVNDAFGAAHRAHASTAGMASFFHEKAAGLLLFKELEYLGRILSSPERPFITILGGAKVSDKIGILQTLLSKVDALLIGGGMAYTFLKARGAGVGKSLVEEERLTLALEIAAQAEARGIPFLLPVDHVVADTAKKNPSTVEGDIPPDFLGLDIGPKTADQFSTEIRKARMALWNGPLGMFEVNEFSRGTISIAKTLAESRAISIVAGGDTVAAITKAGVEEKITHLSTGGGATLEFLEGRKLPGIQALET
ncbi:MAG: phosphoglycerate kinase [Deltaproteobacteria bacterium]|nr:phosphoglycerate kinase [Deltaproteobacteria bacterium]